MDQNRLYLYWKSIIGWGKHPKILAILMWTEGSSMDFDASPNASQDQPEEKHPEAALCRWPRSIPGPCDQDRSTCHATDWRFLKVSICICSHHITPWCDSMRILYMCMEDMWSWPQKEDNFLSSAIPSLQERFAFLEQVFAHPQLRQQWRRPPESEIHLWLLASRATLRNGFRDESAWYRNGQPGWKRMTALVEQWAAARRLQRKKYLKRPAASKAEVCEKGRKQPSTTATINNPKQSPAFLVHGNKKTYWINLNYYTVCIYIYIKTPSEYAYCTWRWPVSSRAVCCFLALKRGIWCLVSIPWRERHSSAEVLCDSALGRWKCGNMGMLTKGYLEAAKTGAQATSNCWSVVDIFSAGISYQLDD